MKRIVALVKKRKRELAVGFLILLVGFFIRFYNLTVLPVFADEAIYVRWSQIMFNEATLRFLPLSDGKQPLYHWVLMYIVHRFSDPLFAGRLVSVATGILTIGGVFALTQLLFKNWKVSLAAATMWMLTPFAVFYDRLALVDSMLCMWAVWMVFFAVWSAKARRLDLTMITGFALGFAALTKSPALFLALLLPLIWFVYNKFKKIYLLIPAFLIAWGMYNILRLGPGFHLLSSRTADYVFPISHLWINPKDPLIFHIRDIAVWLWQLMPAPALGLMFLGLFVNWKKYWREVLVLGAWFLVPNLIQGIYAKVFTDRYILFTVPPLFILAAGAWDPRVKFNKRLFEILMAVFLVQAAWFDWLLITKPALAPMPRRMRSGHLEEWTAGTGIAEISVYLKVEAQANPGMAIVVGTEGYFGTLPDGLQIYLEGVKNVNVIGTGLAHIEVPKSLQESKAAGNKTYFVVNSDRLIVDWQQLPLELVAAYPKELRTPGTAEYINNGPQEVLYFFELK